MTLATYDNLKTSIGVWLAREGDTTLANYADDFIGLFEVAACRKLKVRLQESTTTLTPSSGVATLPTNYLGYRRVTWTGSPNHDLEYVAPPVWSSLYPADTGAAIPVVFTIEGTNLRVGPSDDTALTFDYFARTAALSGTLNWLYTYHFDAYLFGSLCEASAFNKDLDRAGVWKARRDEIFQEIALVDFNERQGMAVRVIGVTP